MDYKTLFFTHLASITVYAAFAGLLALYNRKVHGLCWISGGLLVGLVKVILQGLEGRIPTVFSSLVANELYLLSFVMQMMGLRWFVHRRPLRRRWPLALLTGLAGLYAVLYSLRVPYIANLINIPAFIVLGTTAWLMLRYGHGLFRQVSRWTAAFLFAEMAVSIYRAVLTNLHYALPWKVADGEHDSRWIYSLMAMMFFSTCVIMCQFWFFVVELQGELIEQTRIDPLTGALNRRALYIEADREIARCLRSGQVLCTLLLDIDDFKLLNDTHGHGAGDLCLQSLASLIRTTLRKQDMFARTGGEEFAIVLPDTPQEHALMVAERLRFALERMECNFGESRFYISVSIGVAAMAPTCAAFESLLHCADLAMYEAKHKGKNRIAQYRNDRPAELSAPPSYDSAMSTTLDSPMSPA
ncbi:MAG: GGDEF domain-containing protein [Acidobacteriota bacterium]